MIPLLLCQQQHAINPLHYTDNGTEFYCTLAAGLSSVLRPRQHSIGYTGEGFYRSKDPTNSIKVLKEKAVKENNPPKNKENTNYTYAYTHKYSIHE